MSSNQNDPKDLEPRDCPACGKPCVPKKSKNGWFMGCPDFPRCPGKVEQQPPTNVVPDEAAEKLANGRLLLAIRFVQKIGGTQEARRWLNVVELIFKAKEDLT